MKLKRGLSDMKTTCGLVFVVDLRFLLSSVLTTDLHVFLMTEFWRIEEIHTFRFYNKDVLRCNIGGWRFNANYIEGQFKHHNIKLYIQS
jgi:hypothetical protein